MFVNPDERDECLESYQSWPLFVKTYNWRHRSA
jgi:hypothetical protein